MIPVANPAEEILAIFGAELTHVTSVVMIWVEPSE